MHFTRKCVLAAMVALMLAGLCACGGSGDKWPVAPSGIEWEKGHSPDKVMNIHTKTAIPGTAAGEDGKASKAGMVLYQDKDGFFAVLFGKDRNLELAAGPSGASFPIDAIWRPGQDDEYVQELEGIMAPGSRYVLIRGPMRGLVQGALEGGYDDPGWLVFHAPDGLDYTMPLPGDTKYHEMWEAACDKWYVPTEDDSGFYQGEGPDPELSAWLKEFEAAFNENLDFVKRLGISPVTLLAVVTAENGSLQDDWDRFEEMSNLSLRADYEAWAECRNRIDLKLAEAGIKSGIETGSAIGNFLEGLWNAFG